MFQGLLKPKFPTKCKSYIKPIKTRLDTIMKKKKAVQKILKNDIAELLRNDLDINAYGRVEGLLIEENMTYCYEQIGTFCNCVLEHLQALQMQKECPDECKEAVHSLIYAAARFADLPELRSLRTLFTKKYGESHDSCVNKEFVQKLTSRAFSKEMKLQLLHEIAQEHSLKWDSRPLEMKLYKPPSSEQEKHKVNEQLEKREGKWRNSFASNRDEFAIGVQSTSEDESITDMSSQDGGKASSSSIASVSDDEADNIKRPFYYRFIPPPYLKQKPAMEETNSAKPSTGSARDHCESPVATEKSKPISVSRRHLKPPPGHEDQVKSPEDERGGNFNSPRDSGKSKAYAKAHQPKEAYDHSGENSRRRRPNLNVHVHRAEKKSNDEMPVVTSPKHRKPPEYDEVAALLAALRKN